MQVSFVVLPGNFVIGIVVFLKFNFKHCSAETK